MNFNRTFSFSKSISQRSIPLLGVIDITPKRSIPLLGVIDITPKQTLIKYF